ncbi:hypothetical protein MLD38_023324 [Melastoma candidum]|uniref:Uncharacterized protein n=1 Tax=Melastoma candidum TaxID=119954 RepID=A0ACB9QM21_9MYRT|nr:hypothetical protein MLD38_023324 [Melastoma candidum]
MSEAAGHCYGNEPLTQAGWLFVQNETRQIIHWAMGFRNQIDFHRVKSFLQDSLVIKHPHWSVTAVAVNVGGGRPAT